MSFSEIKFSGRYKLQQLVQKTQTKSIFKGRNTQTGELVLIKTEFFKARNANILYEGKFLQMTQGCPGIPWMHWCGPESEECNCLIVQHLGWSLEHLLDFCGGSFSLKTIAMLGLRLLEIIEVYHFKELVHRRICPHVLQMGKGKKNHILFLNDLLNSRKYIDTKSGEHIPNRQTPGAPIGSTIFSSYRTLSSEQPSRRDDMQSMLLTLIYFFKGDLPWNNRQSLSNINQISSSVIEILRIRKDLTNKELCEGLPIEFQKMMDYVNQLDFTEQPNYTFFKKMFKKVMAKNKFQDDSIYDWVSKGIVKEYEVQNLNLQQSPVYTEIMNNQEGFVRVFYKPFEIGIDVNDIQTRYRRIKFGINHEEKQEPSKSLLQKREKQSKNSKRKSEQNCQIF